MHTEIKSQQIEKALVDRAFRPDRDSGQVEYLADYACERNQNIDVPFSCALHSLIDKFIGDPDNLYGILLATEKFARRAGAEQIGPSSCQLIKRLLSDDLEQYRSAMNPQAARVRGAAIQLAQAAHIPLGYTNLRKEEALYNCVRPLWLAIIRREIDPANAQREYFNAIAEGVITAQDIIGQFAGMMDYSGLEFTLPIVKQCCDALLQKDPQEAHRLAKFTEKQTRILSL